MKAPGRKVAQIREQTERGVDAVFDPIGGAHLWRSHRALRQGGRLVSYGISASIQGERLNRAALLASFPLLFALRAFPGKSVSWFNISRNALWREDLETLTGLLANRLIQPVIARRLTLGEAAQAHELLQNSAAVGKIVLMCAPGRRRAVAAAG